GPCTVWISTTSGCVVTFVIVRMRAGRAAPNPVLGETGRMRSAEQITDVVTFHGEGPVWSLDWGGLRLVDMLAGGVLTLRDDGAVDRITVGRVAAMVRPRSQGGYVVATEHGLALSDDVTAPPVSWVRLTEDPGERMNEG